MAKSRTEIDPDRFAGSLVALGFDYPNGYRVRHHRHRRDQLVFASRGVLQVAATEGTFVVPASRALWMPAGVGHEIRASGRVAMRTLYLKSRLSRQPVEGCRVVGVSDFLRELIVRAVELGPVLLSDSATPHDCFVEVLLSEVDLARAHPLHVLHLPEATDPRLRLLLARLRANPSDRRSLGQWGRDVGASSRTLNRLFAAELGMSFTKWRQQLRLQHSMTLLAVGSSVSSTALEVGYESLSAFVTMFKRATGRPPSAYRREMLAKGGS